MDDLQKAKVITAVCLLVTSAIASFLPWMLAKRLRKTEYAFSLLNCLSGGIVLGSGLSHMLPDSASGFRAHFGDDSYPYAEMIAGGTLIVLYAIEKIALGGQHSHSDVNFDEEAPMMNISPNGKKKKHGEASHGHKDHAAQHKHASEQNLHHRHAHAQPVVDSDSDAPSEQVVAEEKTINACEVNKNMEAIEDIVDESSHRADIVIQAIVFLVALSMHSLFEGLGLGAETTDNGLYGVLAAVVSHKLLEAFALGLAIYRARFKLWLNIVILIGYALATPIGTIAGMFAATDPENAEFVAAILVSIAAGSFFYISLVEILPNELNKQTSRKRLYPKIALMAFGWGFMAFIALFA